MFGFKRIKQIIGLVLLFLYAGSCNASDYWTNLTDEGKLPFYDLNLSQDMEEVLKILQEKGIKIIEGEAAVPEIKLIVPADQIVSEQINLDFSLSFFRNRLYSVIKYNLANGVIKDLLPIFETEGRLEDYGYAKAYSITKGD